MGNKRKKGWSVWKFIGKLIALGEVDKAERVEEKVEHSSRKKVSPLHTDRPKPNRTTINQEGYVGKHD